jgi:hypothetical protein
LVSRIDPTGGSTGWHRFNLINQFILHVNEWWLLGVRGVEDWGVFAGDVTNQYVLEGVRSGIWGLTLFVTLIVMAFSGVGRLWRREEGNKAGLVMAWALGVSLFVHCMSFIGVSYFGQITMLWYLTLATIGSLADVRPCLVKTKANTKLQRDRATSWGVVQIATSSRRVARDGRPDGLGAESQSHTMQNE